MKQLQIIGNIGYDAVIKESNGSKFVQFTVAVNESYKDKDGNKVDVTDWVSCTSKQLTLCQYLTKGKRIFAQGKFKTTVFQDRSKNWKAGINLNCSSIEFLGGGKKEEGEQNTSTPMPPANDAPPHEEEDLPF
jgi:single-strand DNA-binding protein